MAEKNEGISDEQQQNQEQNQEEQEIEYNLELHRKELQVIEEHEKDYLLEYNKNKVDEKVRDFLLNAFDSKYYNQLTDCVLERKKSLLIDFDDIMNYGTDLYEYLLVNPKVFLRYIETIIYQIDKERDLNYFNEKIYFVVRIVNYPNKVPISKIDVDYNNQLISFRGIVAKQSEKKPYIYKFCLKCPKCKTTKLSFNDDLECLSCENNPRMVKVKDNHVYTNCYYIKIQELNEDLRGQMPKQIECVVLGDACDIIKAGDKLNATGFVQLREIFNSMSKHTPFSIVVNINSIELFTTNDIKNLEISKITEEDERKILEFKKKPRNERLNILIGSYASNIYGHKLVKLGCLVAIVGAGNIWVGDMMLRSRIHVLLCGDPSISKSQLLKFGEKITLGSMYASGRGTTATGLTAAAIKDKDGTFSLQPGYLIFANNSVFWFDEADKPDKEVLSHLHQSMEEGQVSLAKGGQIATLMANTTVVMAANPKHSRYSMDLTVAENINMPDSLITRFDYIFLMIDTKDEDVDRKISRHIDSMYVNRQIPTYGVEVMTTSELIKYIEYVKREDIDPDIPDEALQIYEEFYIDMRKKSNADTIAITPRQKEGMLRTGRAIARLLLDTKVEKFHADVSIELMRHEFETVMKDREGNYNVSQITGKTADKLRGVKLIIHICEELISKEGYTRFKIPKKKIIDQLIDNYNVTEKSAMKLFNDANTEGIILFVSEGYVQLTAEANK